MLCRFLAGAAVCCILAGVPCMAGAAANEENESQIQADLDAFVDEYVSRTNHTMAMNREHPKVFKRKGEYVATYMEIHPQSASAKMKKSSSKHFSYIATLHYEERTYESIGATKKDALDGKFQCVRIRRLTELPRYVKGKWEN